ncbi:sugar transferase [Methylobacterium oxalidis]|uniref:Exopolysaccharide biosynthesis protein n=1 Tax=Methylobacterium oxalidis TaxID=944322 RepID=A0A512IZM7_9HYPH|nr:sugar transferase [Methylobacterium oxalidis]GEP03113.1 exopolysaccharide biosynthesis protein [Methylobacterium oxalidis]GJE31726.1 putative sugar transferase EpsL [Methylobacterium oxalidis]GLS67372.1 exopolysaccharide biosynthesis protein [Methylobacterium oxalidis]
MSAHPPIAVGTEFQQAESAQRARLASSSGHLAGQFAEHIAGHLDSRVKRGFDLTAALCALLLLLPIFLLIALLIRAYDGGPAFYRHRRVGRGQSGFDCLKFRTMRTDSQEALRLYLSSNPAALAEWAETQKLKDDPRITPVGAILRKTSLDELPQLINILRGEMSVVGPRPIVEAEVEKYGSDAAAYFAVRPGLTGAWQVSGRSDTSYAERVRLDRQYVESQSFRGDLVIILRTIPAVFFTRGSY